MLRPEDITAKVKELNASLLPIDYINDTIRAYFSTAEYRRYRTNTPYDEVLSYFCDYPYEPEFPSYYLAEDGEFNEDPKVNKDIEELINVYYAVIRHFCAFAREYAGCLVHHKGNIDESFRKAYLLKKAMEAFDLVPMIKGLSSKISYDNFAQDLILLGVIEGYGSIGHINEKEMAKLKNYSRLYPESKNEIFSLISEAYQKQGNAIKPN